MLRSEGRCGLARSWRIDAVIAEGAAGPVYLAASAGGAFSRPVVVKPLAQNADPGRDLRRRLRALTDAGHGGFARIEDVLPLNGRWSVVMEYVEGVDLATALRAGPLPPRAAMAVAEAAATTLDVAWNQGPGPLRLTHRGLCPHNLRVTVSGEVKLLDFAMRPEAPEKEPSIGRIPYLSPERFRQPASPEADIYALGVVLFELLTGQLPGASANTAERRPPGGTLAAQWKWIRQTSVPLHDLIADMLEPNAKARPNAAEVASVLGRIRARLQGDTLEEWAAKVVSETMAPSPVSRTPGVGTLLVEGAVPDQETDVQGGWSRWLMVAGGALAIGLIGIGVIGFGLSLGLALDGSGVAEAPPPTPAVAPPTAAPAAPAQPPGLAASAPTPPTPSPSTDTSSTGVSSTGAPSADLSRSEGGALASKTGEPSSTKPSVPAPTTAAPEAAPARPAAPAPASAPASAPGPASVSSTGTAPPAAAPPADAPAPSSASAPPPPVATAPAPPPAEAAVGVGTLTVTGDVASAELVGPGGSAAPGKVSAGTWTVHVTLTNGQKLTTRNVVVANGATVNVRCTIAFGGQCRPL